MQYLGEIRVGPVMVNRLSKPAVLLLFWQLLGLASAPASELIPDWRHRLNGSPIPGGVYCDQPYLVTTSDGSWLCCMTTAQGAEGSATQTVVTMRSADRGKTWTKPLPLETPVGPEASYGVLLKVPTGRVYCFYNYNRDNVREVKTEIGGAFTRVDSLGEYVFRYSDDDGKSWSDRRYPVPVREFACDRHNVYGGKVRFFWNVGRPLLVADDDARRPTWTGGPAAILTMHKVGAMGIGFFAQSEGAFLRSDNILGESDPVKLTFATLPEGDVGLRAPPGGGRIAEEQSIVQLTDGSLFCVYRTVDGHPASSTSRDGGKTWADPDYLRYSPGGRKVKHPRAANFVWSLGNGRYLYWFHNHSPTAAQRTAGWDPYSDRNPVWVAAGREIDAEDGKVVAWSEPEILLYDDDPFSRMSYPDLIRHGEQWFVTETNKAEGRVHHIDADFLAGLLAQHENTAVTRKGLRLELPGNGRAMPASVPALQWPAFRVRSADHEDGRGKDLRAGFSMDVWVRGQKWEKSVPLVDATEASGRGVRLTAEPDGSVTLCMSDGQTECVWSSDAGVLHATAATHIAAIVDGGPKLIVFVANGKVCDGGDERQFGWGRFSADFRGPAGRADVRIHPALQSLRVYDRAILVSEAVGNHASAEQ